MKITRMPVGMIRANCYIIESDSKNAAAVDPGDEFEKIDAFLTENSLTLKKILLTHGHFDHIGAVAQLQEKYGAEVYVHADDAVMLTDRRKSLADDMPYYVYRPVEEYTTIDEGDKIELDELCFEVLHTPGHTKGGVCFRCGNALFTGDTLFKMSMGRTDFPGGSLKEIFLSLGRLGKIKENLEVYPGHNETSTLDYERKNNVYMKGDPYEDSI